MLEEEESQKGEGMEQPLLVLSIHSTEYLKGN